MAICSHNTTFLTPQTGSDVRDRAAHVRAFRASMWPAHPPRIAECPVPASPVLALVVIAPQPPGRITVWRVLDVTAEHFGMTADELLSERRTQPLARRRQVAMFVACKVTGRSLPFIGDRFGKDHTTILCGKRAVQALIDAGDARTIATVNAIVTQLIGGANV